MIRVTVLSPAGAVFEGPAQRVVAPAYDGEVGILPRHAPFMALLGEGAVRIATDEGPRTFRVRGGFLQVVQDAVRIVAEHVEEGSAAPHAG